MANVVGVKIKAIRPMTKKELEREYWEPDRFEKPLALELSNGVVLYPSRDSEGNGPGALFGVDGEETFGLRV